MKKIFLFAIAFLFAINFTCAQWTGGPTGPIYYNSGNVGIGTTTPGTAFSEKLSVNGAVNILAGNTLYLSNPSNGNAAAIKSTLTSGTGAADLSLLGGSGNGIFVQNGGNVGVGTTSPVNPLVVSNGGAAGIEFTPSTGVIFGFNRATTAYTPIGIYGSTLSLGIGGSSATAVTINTSSNVGIGTTTPTSSLQVDNPGVGDNNIIISNQTNGYASGAKNMLAFTQGTSAGTLNGRMGFDYSSGTMQIVNGTTIGLAVDRSGYVGVRTATPDEALTVNGTIHSTEVKVTTSVPFPDYVFDKEYHLPKLSEIKTYIDKNHHLPEVPSAAEVEKNGLNLGEMNATLLKKVEELTLYVIQQKESTDKQLRELKRQISTLQIRKNEKRHI